MMDKNITQQQWDLMSIEQKGIFLTSLENYNNKIIKLKEIKTFDSGFTTGIFELDDGAEFIFIPSNTVTLGWERGFEVDKEIEELIRNDGEEFTGEKIDDEDLNERMNFYMQEPTDEFPETMSPVRQVVVSAMLVERDLDFNEIAKNSGFSILTEDEWEYLAGGSYRGLFNEYMTNKIFKNKSTCLNYSELKGLLYNSNKFGLHIAYDTYVNEFVNSPYIKGSDGGCGVCGGYGFVLSYISLSPHYRLSDEELIEGEEEKKYIRRIIKIGLS